jgi:hypothetical protein
VGSASQSCLSRADRRGALAPQIRRHSGNRRSHSQSVAMRLSTKKKASSKASAEKTVHVTVHLAHSGERQLLEKAMDADF